MIEIRNGAVLNPDVPCDIPDGKYYTIKEFAIAHNVSEEKVRVWIKRNMVTRVTIYGKPYINIANGVAYKRKKWALK